MDVKEIAKEFGITTVRVYQITNSYKPEPQPVIQKPRTVFQMLFGGRGG